MSRYELPGKEPNTRVCFGWDHPLLTYFLQVYKGKRGHPSIWLGGSLRELYDLDDLKRVAWRHVAIPEDMLVQLYRDRDEGR